MSRAGFAIVLTLACAGCGKSAVPVGLEPAYLEAASAAYAVGLCSAAGEIRQKSELSTQRTEIDGRISAAYGDAVLADLTKKANAQFPGTTSDPCPGDPGFRKYRGAVSTLSGMVG